MPIKQDILRGLPSVDEIMSVPKVVALTNEHDREVVVQVVRQVIDALRSQVLSSEKPQELRTPVAEIISNCVVTAIQAKFSPSLRWAINAAGIILHTGLGRAVMPEAGYRCRQRCHQRLLHPGDRHRNRAALLARRSFRRSALRDHGRRGRQCRQQQRRRDHARPQHPRQG